MPQFGTLTVTVDAREHEAIVAITDNGGGIPGDYLTEILDPFFSTFSHKGGVGLGLSVAYSIVRQHGGRMEVDSSHHTGTTFHVIRPMGKVSN
jgi:signal transduction histidine kinase